MKKLGIFGGSFNPIHNGHISFCLQANQHILFDEILIIPNNIPPHKDVIVPISNEDRMNMIKLAIKDYDFINLSDIEYKMGSKSYTINTVNELMKIYKGYKIYIIIGSDMLLTFDEWKNYEELLDKTNIICGYRDYLDIEKLYNIKQKYKKYYDKITIIPIDITPISSTQIRDKIKNNESVTGFLNEDIYDYIIQKGLYQN